MDIDDEIRLTMKDTAKPTDVTVGDGLSGQVRELPAPKSLTVGHRNVVPVLLRRGNAPPVTNELIRSLLNEGE